MSSEFWPGTKKNTWQRAAWAQRAFWRDGTERSSKAFQNELETPVFGSLVLLFTRKKWRRMMAMDREGWKKALNGQLRLDARKNWWPASKVKTSKLNLISKANHSTASNFQEGISQIFYIFYRLHSLLVYIYAYIYQGLFRNSILSFGRSLLSTSR